MCVCVCVCGISTSLPVVVRVVNISTEVTIVPGRIAITAHSVSKDLYWS